jgi:hypothetical protein
MPYFEELMKAIVLLVVLSVGAGPAFPQSAARPPWTIRYDAGHGTDSTMELSVMAPGWHATTKGNSGIFYDPSWRASGNYQIRSTIFVFPDSRSEGYGLFLAGEKLDGPDQAYLYFLLRRDGKYLIKHRQGAETHELVPWTDHPAIAKPTADGTGKNVIVVNATADSIAFLVNDKPVTSLARGKVAARGEGTVGLRLNHGLNLHITEVKISPSS